MFTYITLDDVGFLGQVQRYTVRGKEKVGADAPISSHASDALGLLSQGHSHHIQW